MGVWDGLDECEISRTEILSQSAPANRIIVLLFADFVVVVVLSLLLIICVVILRGHLLQLLIVILLYACVLRSMVSINYIPKIFAIKL